MPYKHLEKKIPRELDRRVKLTEDDKAFILYLYHEEKLGIRTIARIFEGICSRRLIQFIIFPERLKQMQERNILNKHHLLYYYKDKWRGQMKNHRDYKQKLYVKNKLI